MGRVGTSSQGGGRTHLRQKRVDALVPQVRRLLKKSGMDRRLAGAGGPVCTSGSAGPASPRCTASAASPSTCEALRLGP